MLLQSKSTLRMSSSHGKFRFSKSQSLLNGSNQDCIEESVKRVSEGSNIENFSLLTFSVSF